MDRERDPSKIFEEFQRRTQADAQPVPASTAATDDESPPDTSVPTEDELAGAVPGGVYAGEATAPGAGAVPESMPRPEELLPGVDSNTGNPGMDAVPGASNRSDLLDVFNQGNQGSRDDIADVQTIFRVHEWEGARIVERNPPEPLTPEQHREMTERFLEEERRADEEQRQSEENKADEDNKNDEEVIWVDAGDDDGDDSGEAMVNPGDWFTGGDPGPDTGSTDMIERDAQQWRQIKAEADEQSTINPVDLDLRTEVAQTIGDHVDLVDPPDDSLPPPTIDVDGDPYAGPDSGNIDFGPDHLDEPPDPGEDPRLFEDRSTGGDSTAAADEYATVDGAQKSFAEQALGSAPFTPDASDLKVAMPEVDAPLAGQVDFDIAATTDDDDDVPA